MYTCVSNEMFLLQYLSEGSVYHLELKQDKSPTFYYKVTRIHGVK